MSLNLTWKNIEDQEFVSELLAGDGMFNIGVVMMNVGFSEIKEDNVVELVARARAIGYTFLTTVMAKRLVGLKANVVYIRPHSFRLKLARQIMDNEVRKIKKEIANEASA